jgi:hypothetical protein
MIILVAPPRFLPHERGDTQCGDDSNANGAARLALGDDGRRSLALADLSVGDARDAHQREQSGGNQCDLLHDNPHLLRTECIIKKRGGLN